MSDRYGIEASRSSMQVSATTFDEAVERVLRLLSGESDD
jgi:hypothetical protein